MSAHPEHDDEESVFGSLLETLAPEQDDVVVLIKSFFDESYDNDVLCVAGYIFTSPNARKLDEDWKRMLLRFRLPFFRMSACNSGTAPFDHLTKDECIAVQTEAIALIGKYAAYGCAVTVDQKAFWRIIGKDGFVRSPYEFCAWQILTAVLSWMDDRPGNWGTAFFFESGHQHQGLANTLIKRLFADESFVSRYRYKSHSFIDKDAVRPIQAADLLSWQWFKDYTRRKNGATKSRADCAALVEGTPHRVLHVDEAILQRLVEWMDQKAGGGDGNKIAGLALRRPFAPFFRERRD
jgi:hypothetical protein